jgi:hypothetical protein
VAEESDISKRMLKSLLHRTASSNPLWDFFIPLVVLWFCSSTGPRPWQVGPAIAMLLALAFPLWGLARTIASTRRISLSSVFGLASILLMGAVTSTCWLVTQRSPEQIAIAYSIKELCLLFMVGLFFVFADYLISGFSRKLLLWEKLFRIEVIRTATNFQRCEKELNQIIRTTLLKIGIVFCFCAVLNSLLAYFICHKMIYESSYAMTQFNQAVALHSILSVILVFPILFLSVIFLIWSLVSRMQYILNIPWRRLIV